MFVNTQINVNVNFPVLFCLIQGCIYVGGVDKMWQLNVDGGRVKFFEYGVFVFS